MQIFVNSKYDFIKWRYAAVAFSVIWILVGLGFFIKRGINWGIDFAGGASITLKFKDAVPLDRLRAELKDASIQQYGKAEERAVLIRLPQQGREGDYAAEIVGKLNRDLNPQGAGKLDLNYQGRDGITELLASTDPDIKGTNAAAHDYYKNVAQNVIARRSELGLFTNTSQVTSTPGVTTGIARVLNEKTFLGSFNVLNQETVGPQVGKELQQKALMAVLLSTLAMGIYLWLRFDLMFGISAVMCIIHDVLISIAFLGMINGEFMHSQAKTFAEQLQKASKDSHEQVRLALNRALQRQPNEKEIARGLQFLKDSYAAALERDFILVSLYVDDRKLLPDDQQFLFTSSDGSKKAIKTVGDKFITLQSENFKNASQPLYAIISPDEKVLTLPVGYTPSADEYTHWLQCGIDAFRKVK